MSRNEVAHDPVLLSPVAKRVNIGTIVRSAVAFGVEGLMVVGDRKKVRSFGDQNTLRFLDMQEFQTLKECKEEITRQNFRLVGIEIDQRSRNVAKHPFTGNTVFVLGNEGTGLGKNILEICDDLVYIPQHFPGTASLNVAIAGSIVLHQFAQWAGYPECRFEGQKFEVDSNQSSMMRNATPEILASIERSRSKKRARLLEQQQQKQDSSEASDKTSVSDGQAEQVGEESKQEKGKEGEEEEEEVRPSESKRHKAATGIPPTSIAE